MSIIKKDKLEDKGFIYLKPEEVPHKEEGEFPSEFEEQPVAFDAEKGENPEESAREKASQVVSQAQREAQGLVARARAEAETIKKQAEIRGREEGKKEGLSDVGGKIKEALETINQAVKERKKIIKDSENELLRLAIRIAEQIIRSEVSLHRDVCLNIVSDAINRVSDREQIVIKVNRVDLEQVKQARERIAGVVDGVKNLSVLEDSQVEPGGCVIETNLGFVDARISTKIKAIEEALKKVSAGESKGK